MGEVYRARDTRLGREIALKILPESFARESDRLHRFEQEARAVAALNHPNILAVFDIGQHNGSPFLVSELLEGETLRAVLDYGALPQRKTIEYGVQIAQGLAAAHDKGIVHRDLKPENVFVTKDARVKILDFGLAKLAQKSSAAGADSDGITLTSSHTAAGVVMGTAGYMAPEQVRGESSDPRTDIFAFGAVLYEMLSGQRAFCRDTTAETMTAVLKEDPPDLPDPSHPVSPALDRTVRRCLEKNPEQRFQSTKDLSFALAALSGSDTSGAVRAAPNPRKMPPLLWVAMPLALAAVAVATWTFSRPSFPIIERLQFAMPVAGDGEVSHMSLSADGKMLAFVSPDAKSAVPMLHVQRVGTPEATLMPGTEGASYPFWSPDDGYVAFFANAKLQKMAASGGSPQTLASVSSARGGSWGKKNVIIYAPAAADLLWRVNADGSAAAALTASIATKEDQSHRWPVFLPDGDHFLFWAGNFANAPDDRTSGIYLSSLSAKDRKLVTLVHSNIGYAAGNLLYVDDKRQLIAAPFDVSRATVSGEPRVVVSSVGYQPSTYWGAFAASEEGTLVYNASTYAASSALVWIDRSGKELGRVGHAGVLANPSISPGGDRVAVDITDEKAHNVDVWIESLQGGTDTRFTFDPSEEVIGVWSRDGKLIAYRNSAYGSTLFPTLLVKSATGREKEKPIFALANGLGDIFPNSWTPDDRQILATMSVRGSRGAAVSSKLVLVPASGGEPAPFLATKGDESNGQISPDGKWVAYASNESGEWEVYVTTFPDASGKWQVSRGGGIEPRWRGDTREIFYIGPSGNLIAVPVESAGTFSTGVPAILFQVYGRAPISSTDVFTYDVTKDGKRFLVNRYLRPDQVIPLTIVLHATANPPK
jgi:Tol biopolymer transport system component